VKWWLLSGMPPEEAREILAIARRRAFGRGEVVFRDGDLADSLHLVVSGRYGVRVAAPRGVRVLLSVLGPGDAFGELGLLEEDRRGATVTALEAGETRAVFREDFERLRRSHPRVDRLLIAALAQQVRRADARLVEAYHVDAETRVRRRLRELADFYPAATIPLTQGEIAEMAGTSRATVNRVLREEEARGTVALGRGRTKVLDPARLGSTDRGTPGP
jgi:CRP/FNR family transcriptional regulator, cyclic AMP receptor protein